MSFPPRPKPRREFINVTTPIKMAGLSILFPKSDNEIPAEKASILVAIPTSKRHLRSMQSCFSFSFSKAYFINLTPRYVNIAKTINPAYGSIKDFTNPVR